MQAVAFLLCARAHFHLVPVQTLFSFLQTLQRLHGGCSAISKSEWNQLPSFVAVQRNALHDYSGLIKVRTVPSSVAAVMPIEGTPCARDSVQEQFRDVVLKCLPPVPPSLKLKGLWFTSQGKDETRSGCYYSFLRDHMPVVCPGTWSKMNPTTSRGQKVQIMKLPCHETWVSFN